MSLIVKTSNEGNPHKLPDQPLRAPFAMHVADGLVPHALTIVSQLSHKEAMAEHEQKS